MGNRKLSIGCVLIVGGTLTNCGGTVETQRDGMGNDHGGAPGVTGYVGVPATGTGGGFMGTCCPGASVGGYVGATGGSYTAGRDGYVGGGDTFIGSGGAPEGGTPGLTIYVGGEGGHVWNGGAGGAGGDDGL